MKQSALFLLHQTQGEVIVPGSNDRINSNDRKSPLAVLYGRLSMNLSITIAQGYKKFFTPSIWYNHVNLLLSANSFY